MAGAAAFFVQLNRAAGEPFLPAEQPGPADPVAARVQPAGYAAQLVAMFFQDTAYAAPVVRGLRGRRGGTRHDEVPSWRSPISANPAYGDRLPGQQRDPVPPGQGEACCGKPGWRADQRRPADPEL